ncbi:MAG TPA: hypothetical protein VIH18_27025 [Candidatus Binatia bacterium]
MPVPEVDAADGALDNRARRGAAGVTIVDVRKELPGHAFEPHGRELV